MSATPLIEPVVPAANAAVVSAPSVEPARSVEPETNPFGVPLPVQSDSQHEQTQQEDYLWGV
jgi:hypothetical protein